MSLTMPTHQEYYQTPGHIVAAAIALPVADSVAVLLRFLARRRLRQPLKVDDWLMLPASKTNVAGKVQFASVLILPLALGLIKLSVLFFYMRIFTVTATSITYKLLVALNVLVSMWAVGFFLANLFQCRLDTWAMWTTTKDLQMHCPGSMYYSLALGITDFSADLIIICIPIVPALFIVSGFIYWGWEKNDLWILGVWEKGHTVCPYFYRAQQCAGTDEPTVPSNFYWGNNI
ncbi:hypothetical protein GQ53DRAFT_803414 [Thozetella sp. PMI_491]|nr:hypothetical protein GQ53DRAFT_803414 [Thozetella sp. PMI_491]